MNMDGKKKEKRKNEGWREDRTTKKIQIENTTRYDFHSFHFIYFGTVAPAVQENCFSGAVAQTLTVYDLIFS